MSFDLGGAIGGALIGLRGGAWGAVAGFFIGGFTAGDAQRSAKNKARSAFNDAQKDRQQMVQSATAATKIVYGRAKVSGPIAFPPFTGGSKGELLHMVVLLTGHEIDAVETVYLNDTALTLDGSGNATNADFNRTTVDTTNAGVFLGAGTTTAVVLPGTMTRVIGVTSTTVNDHDWTTLTLAFTVSGSTVTITRGAAAVGAPVRINYEYTTSTTPLIKVKAYLGTTTQAADTDLIAASGGKWTSAHQLRGISYLYIRVEYDPDVFGAIGLGNWAAVVRGYKVWDPRTSTTAWRENSALCTAHYLRNYMGAAAGEVPDAELTVEANSCDELVTTATGVTEARYTCNGALSTETSPRDNLDAIVESMAGSVAWAQGRFVIRAGRHLAAEFTIDESTLADGAVSIQPSSARTELYNRIVAKYVEPARGYVSVEAPAVTNSTYVTEDGGLDLPLDLPLELVTGVMRAQRLAKIELERNRQGMRVQINCNLMAYDVKPGDTVALTISRYGWSAKLFTVVERAHDFSTQTVRLSLRETASAVWDWAFGVATAVDLTPNTTLPNPYAKPATLAGLAVASGTSYLQLLGDGTVQCRALVSWTQSSNIFVTKGGSIEVAWSRVDSDVWVQPLSLAGDATSTLIGPLEEGFAINLRVRAVSQQGKQGLWSYAIHTPVGKSAPPADVTSLSATVIPGGILIGWAPNGELDYAFTELRRGASWAAGTAIDGSAVTAKPTRVVGTSFPWAWPAAGAYTVWAAHVDSSGNVSSTPASVGVTVDGTMLTNTAQIAPGAVSQSSTALAASATISALGAATTTRSGSMSGPSITASGRNVSVGFSGSIVVYLSGNLGRVVAISPSLELWAGGTLYGNIGSYTISNHYDIGLGIYNHGLSISAMFNAPPAGSYTLKLSCGVACYDPATGFLNSYLVRLDAYGDFFVSETKV